MKKSQFDSITITSSIQIISIFISFDRNSQQTTKKVKICRPSVSFPFLFKRLAFSHLILNIALFVSGIALFICCYKWKCQFQCFAVIKELILGKKKERKMKKIFQCQNKHYSFVSIKKNTCHCKFFIQFGTKIQLRIIKNFHFLL